MFHVLIVFLLFVSRFLFLSPIASFFDGPEYVRLIENPNLLYALTNGHEPIHPGYILPSWIFYHMFKFMPNLSALYVAEIVSAVFSVLGLFVFYLIVKELFDKAIAIRALTIAGLLPVLWLAGINVLTDTTYIFFFLLSLFSIILYIRESQKKWLVLGILALAYSVFTHTQVILWTPVFFAFIFSSKNKWPATRKVILFMSSGILLGIFLLLLLLYFIGNSFVQGFGALFIHGQDVVLSGNVMLELAQFARNFSITILRNNSSFIIAAAVTGLIVLWKSRFKKHGKRNLAICVLWFLPMLLTSQYWHIGLFGRVSVMASFPIAILAAQIKSKVVFVLLVLSLIFISVPLVISNRNAHIQGKLEKLYNLLPTKSLLISSNLIRPQVTFSGETYFINEPGQDIKFIEVRIDTALKHDRGVYIDSQALYNPYYSYDGNRLHILSLGSIGKSEIAPIFKKYKVRIVNVIDADNKIFLYQINPPDKSSRDKKVEVTFGKSSPGKEVFLYSDKLAKRINPNRIDYRDIGTWLWVLLTGRNEPVLWTIADKTGTYQFPTIPN